MSDIKLRIATPDDAAALAALHVAGWQDAYGGAVDADWLAGQSVAERRKDWTRWLEEEGSVSWLAVPDGAEAPAGFVTLGRTRTPPPGSSPIRPAYVAEIYALYVRREMWRQGIGAALLRQAAAGALERKWPGLCLWALEANRQAGAFYTALGAQKLGKKKVQIGPSEVTEACYGWRDLRRLLTA